MEATVMNSDDSDANQGLPDDEYDAWFKAKILRARLDPRPSVPHEEVMSRAKTAIQAAIDRRKDQQR